ncbi:unnamed protein product [Paramecium octaurelia]|uniref:Uncharacterized protein n=1 Tax=Paramecium octaurelia TaxID=43137 RepID=A0A8S1VVB4_PAROT|nr:unnamed protein product [Paramecium octaurelia]
MDFMKYQRCQKISILCFSSYFNKQAISYLGSAHHFACQSTSSFGLAISIKCLCDNASSTVLEELQQLQVNHTEQLSQIPPLFMSASYFQMLITVHMLDEIINLRPQRFEFGKEIQKKRNIEVH